MPKQRLSFKQLGYGPALAADRRCRRRPLLTVVKGVWKRKKEKTEKKKKNTHTHTQRPLFSFPLEDSCPAATTQPAGSSSSFVFRSLKPPTVVKPAPTRSFPWMFFVASCARRERGGRHSQGWSQRASAPAWVRRKEPLWAAVQANRRHSRAAATARSPDHRATQALIAAGLEAAGTVAALCLANRRRRCAATFTAHGSLFSIEKRTAVG